jgi:hypothetical protein
MLNHCIYSAGPGTSFALLIGEHAALLKQAVPNFHCLQERSFYEDCDSMGSNYNQVDQGAGFVDSDEAVKYLKEHNKFY